MNNKLTKLAQIVLPTFTLVLGIFIGMHYLSFQGQVVKYIYGDEIREDVGIGRQDVEDKKGTEGRSHDLNLIEEKTEEGLFVLPTESEIEIEKFWDVWNTLKDKFLISENINSDDVLYGLIIGAVESLEDKYTVFLKPDESKDFQIEVSGELEGIGAELIFRKKALTVASVVKESPAKKAGLKTDDIILKIDDESASDLGFYESINKIRGEKGTEVRLTVFREGEDEALEFNIVRDEIHVENVIWEKVDNKFAHLTINRFTSDVNQELTEIATEILAFDPEGIILDLRDDGGGYMDQAVLVADAFINSGPIVSRKYKSGQEDYFKATKNTIFDSYPLVVLINGESASASEIVAGALQDYERAKIIGETSYGKGSVQQTFNFGEAILKVTVAKWYTPKKRNIDDIGIEPDIAVEYSLEDFEAELDPQLDRAIEYLQTGE
jgi:carboxyl-terminal processing protease